MMKTRKENDVIDRIGMFYVENDIELSWLIGPCVVYDENQTWQRRDQSYKCGLSWSIRSGVFIDDN